MVVVFAESLEFLEKNLLGVSLVGLWKWKIFFLVAIECDRLCCADLMEEIYF